MFISLIYIIITPSGDIFKSAVTLSESTTLELAIHNIFPYAGSCVAEVKHHSDTFWGDLEI